MDKEIASEGAGGTGGSLVSYVLLPQSKADFQEVPAPRTSEAMQLLREMKMRLGPKAGKSIFPSKPCPLNAKCG